MCVLIRCMVGLSLVTITSQNLFDFMSQTCSLWILLFLMCSPMNFLWVIQRVALDRPSTIVITNEMALKYFGKENPVGKALTLSGGWAEGEYEVTGIIKEVPQNSHFTFDFLINIHNLLQNEQYKNDDGWGWSNFVTYVQLHPQADLKAAHDKMPAFIEKYRGKDLAESNSKVTLTLQPIRDIHLRPGLDNESSATTSVNTIYFFILISIFILAIAWVNYINLATARAMERAREVGVKKSVGAYKSQLISQFFFESVLVNFLGVALAVLLATALLPFLGDIVEKNFSFDFSDIRLWLILTLLFLLGSFVSGIYPAFVLSSFNPTAVLKGECGKNWRRDVPSKSVGDISICLFIIIDCRNLCSLPSDHVFTNAG